MTIIETILPYLSKYSILISFLGGFVTGESIIIGLAFLSATGTLPIWNVIIFCTLGMFLSDFIPFTIGRHKWFVKTLWGKKFFQNIKNVEKIVHKYAKHNLFFVLIVTKFVYGTSIPTLLYLGSKKITYRRFLINDFLAVIIFVPVIILIGWSAGKGYNFATNIFNDLRIALLIMVILIILYRVIRKWIDLKIKQKQLL